MLSFLFGILFSKAGLIGIGGGLAIAAVLTAILRFPWWVPLALAIAAVVHIYTGAFVNYGRGLERAEWVEKLEAEQDRQEAAVARADTLEADLAVARAERDQLRTDLGVANEAEIELQAQLEDAEREAEIAAGGVPRPCACTDSSRDVERLYERLKR